MKKCSKCQLEKSLDDFNKDRSRYDNLNTKCKTCCKNIYQFNKEKYINRSKINRSNKKEHYKEISKKRYNKNKKKILKEKKIYQNQNKEKINKYNRNRHKLKMNDPIYKLRRNLRFLNRRYIKSKKNKKSYEILGCSIEDFKLYLESKFEPWMNWENYGSIKGKQPISINQCWDLDHMIPLSYAKTEEEIIKLNHYSNLRPLCSFTNRWIKRDNYEKNNNRFYSNEILV